jgi:hypothetical protein
MPDESTVVVSHNGAPARFMDDDTIGLATLLALALHLSQPR